MLQPSFRSPFSKGDAFLSGRRPAARRYRRVSRISNDLYGILQVPDTATKAEIKTAYRHLAKELHPDLNAGLDPGFRFQAVADAYAVLSDDRLRRRYDEGGYAALGSRFARYAAVEWPARRAAEPGKDVMTVMWLDFVEAALGVERLIEVKVATTCPDCQGVRSTAAVTASCPLCRGTGETRRNTRFNGRLGPQGPCPMCGGKGATVQQWCPTCGSSGLARVKRLVKVRVPPGVDGNSVLRLKGSGDEGRFGGKPGDVYVTFVVKFRRDISRRGLDLISNVTVAYTDAILGSSYEVQTIRGTAMLQIPPGTQHGTVLKVAGAGIDRKGQAAGAHLYKVIVRLPLQIGRHERAILQQLVSLRDGRTEPQ